MKPACAPAIAIVFAAACSQAGSGSPASGSGVTCAADTYIDHDACVGYPPFSDAIAPGADSSVPEGGSSGDGGDASTDADGGEASEADARAQDAPGPVDASGARPDDGGDAADVNDAADAPASDGATDGPDAGD